MGRGHDGAFFFMTGLGVLPFTSNFFHDISGDISGPQKVDILHSQHMGIGESVLEFAQNRGWRPLCWLFSFHLGAFWVSAVPTDIKTIKPQKMKWMIY
jgi:hypothetical protein